MKKQKKAVIAKAEKLAVQKFGKERAARVMREFWKEYGALCEENKEEPKAVRRHTREHIYPAIGFYRAMCSLGIKKEWALHFVDEAFAVYSEGGAKAIRMLLKIPKLYKTMPALWRSFVPKMFGEDAGFRSKFYDMGKNRVKFDMQVCPYAKTCEKYGCPELTQVFCHTDDICYGNMHPKLIWNRTKTIGRGADCCDFDIIVKK